MALCLHIRGYSRSRGQLPSSSFPHFRPTGPSGRPLSRAIACPGMSLGSPAVAAKGPGMTTPKTRIEGVKRGKGSFGGGEGDRSAPPAASAPPCAGASRWRPTRPDPSPPSPVGAGGSRRTSRRARTPTARGRWCRPTTPASSRAPPSRPRAAPAAPWQGAVGARSGRDARIHRGPWPERTFPHSGCSPHRKRAVAGNACSRPPSTCVRFTLRARGKVRGSPWREAAWIKPSSGGGQVLVGWRSRL